MYLENIIELFGNSASIEVFIKIIIILAIIIFSGTYSINYTKNSLYYPSFTSYNYTYSHKDFDDSIEEHFIHFGGGNKLYGWYYPGKYKDKSKPIILFCHGNGGNISNRFYHINSMIENDIPFFIFDYQGYGKSDGSTYMESTYDDAKKCYDYMKDVLNITGDIIPLGESIGSYPASKLAKELKLKKVIILSGFYNMNKVVMELFPYPIINSILDLLTRGDLDVGGNLSKFQGKSLILHSEEDTLISYDNAIKNKDAHAFQGHPELYDHNIPCPAKCTFKTIKGNHNNPIIDWNIIKEFITQ